MTMLHFSFRQFLSSARSAGLARMFIFSFIVAAMMSASQVQTHPGFATKAQLHTEHRGHAVGVVDAAEESSARKAKKAAQLALKIGYNLGKVGGVCYGADYLLKREGKISNMGDVVVDIFLVVASMCYLTKSIYDDIVPSRQKVGQKSSGFKKVVNILGNMGGVVLPFICFVGAAMSKEYGEAGVFAVSTIALGENIYKIVKQHRAEKAGSVPEVVTEAA